MGEPEFERIKSILAQERIPYELFVHGPARTSIEAAKARGTELRQGTKSLLLRAGSGFLFALIPAHMRLDTSKMEALANVKKVRFASPQEVLEQTGCEVGAVPPFGLGKSFPVYLDRAVLENEAIAFNVGLRTHSIRMRSSDLLRLISPVLGDFSKPAPA